MRGGRGTKGGDGGGVLARILREPLIHFFVAGGVLWAAHRALVPDAATARRIVIAAPVQASLIADFSRRTARAPTATERAAILADYVDDEVLYREALARGLDRGDVIVRRRLIQKMGFVAERTQDGEPDEAALGRHLETHAARYLTPPRVALRHVFVRRAADGAQDAGVRASALRERLTRGADPATLGDPFLHGAALPLSTETELAARFGPAFAQAALALPEGAWSAPVTSSYGLHLVQITAREPAHAPKLSEVRDQLARDLGAELRAQARRRALDELRTGYEVRIEAAP